ncbi:hypothetical protein IV203_035535 [Nitzschia inconspicua]|uniref:Uncharacterized protein n=1 Tax=Nitzschia inconspicua TaxID=303405 RepID=A0A9K3LGG2_9STRA|nr:hypothetical protein IV203_035535 [Nitzschia inconspicua]
MVPDMKSELCELRRAGEESEMKYRQELSKLRSDLAALQKVLREKTSRTRMPLYQQAIRDIFVQSKAGLVTTSGLPQPYVIKIQAQLCHSLHSNEIYRNQLHMLEHHGKRLTRHLGKRKEELKSKNGDRKKFLKQRLEGRTMDWQHHLEELQRKTEAQQSAINELQKQLNLGKLASSPTMDDDTDSARPRSQVGSFSVSVKKLVGEASVLGAKISVAPPLLDFTKTHLPLSLFNMWINLKRNKANKQKLEESFAELKSLQGSLILSDLSMESFHDQSSSSVSYMMDEHNNSFGSTEKVEHFEKRNRMESASICWPGSSI